MKIKTITLELSNNESRYIIGSCYTLFPTMILLGFITTPILILISALPLIIGSTLQLSMEDE